MAISRYGCLPTNKEDRYMEGGVGCIWDGAPNDPSFQDASAWMTTLGAVVLEAASGSIAPGAVFFAPSSICDLATVSQVVTMPSRELAEPLALDFTARYQGSSSVDMAVAVNQRWLPLQSAIAFETTRICLGDAAYGGDVEFAAGADPAFCDNSTLEFDHFEVVPDGTCPIPGDIVNSNLEVDGGWIAGGNGPAAITAGVGKEGSRGGRVSTLMGCSNSTLTGKASPQSVIASPALEAYWYTGVGDRMDVALSGQPFVSLAGSGAANASTSRLCLPPGLTGWGHEISFSLPYAGGACASPDIREGVFDDLLLVSEPSCGTDPNIVDGGFESALLADVLTPWSLSFVVGKGSVRFHNNPALANTGNGSLEFTLQQQCSIARAETLVRIPEAAGNNGPAVELAYTTGVNPQTTLVTSPASTAITEGNGYATATICLPTKRIGRMQNISITLDRSSGTCANTFAVETARVDDVVVTTSALCPVN